MLADAGSFCRVFRRAQPPELPKDPEAIADPKRHLEMVLKGMGARTDRGIGKYYADLGREVRRSELERLPAFRRFAGELRAAIEEAARGQRS
ncbi:MAG: hypothetical protein IT372_21850 [Polyangiaceae bacterium]|nr:hypothetical protein [Polyangiaceae bacterium]